MGELLSYAGIFLSLPHDICTSPRKYAKYIDRNRQEPPKRRDQMQSLPDCPSRLEKMDLCYINNHKNVPKTDNPSPLVPSTATFAAAAALLLAG